MRVALGISRVAHAREAASTWSVDRIDEWAPLILRETKARQFLPVALQADFIMRQRQRLHPRHRLRIDGEARVRETKNPEEKAEALHVRVGIET